jgi:hypothetical protein
MQKVLIGGTLRLSLFLVVIVASVVVARFLLVGDSAYRRAGAAETRVAHFE